MLAHGQRSFFVVIRASIDTLRAFFLRASALFVVLSMSFSCTACRDAPLYADVVGWKLEGERSGVLLMVVGGERLAEELRAPVEEWIFAAWRGDGGQVSFAGLMSGSLSTTKDWLDERLPGVRERVRASVGAAAVERDAYFVHVPALELSEGEGLDVAFGAAEKNPFGDCGGREFQRGSTARSPVRFLGSL